MKDIRTVSKALRCISTIPQPEHDCASCEYAILTKVDDIEKVQGERLDADVIVKGVEYCVECDCDKINLDAAAIIDILAYLIEKYSGAELK